MKVLFYVRANKEQVKGGDLIQLYKTGECLIKNGVDVDYSSDPNKNLNDYDIVHIFNSPRFYETQKFFDNAKKYKKPVAFSTIYWPKDELAVGAANNRSVRMVRDVLGVETAKKYRLMATKLKAFIRKDKSQKIEKYLFKKADILLPNSVSEMKQIELNYKLKNKYKVVCNAVDTTMFSKVPNKKREGYVLSVGRIESRKNTLSLIESCKELNLDLVLIGGYEKGDEYDKECIELVKKYGYKHINNIDQEKLTKYYYDAKVHAIVAWYETPGLATMEAACGGCNIVSTDRGSTRDYFGDLVDYCDPFSLESIKKALLNAVNRNINFELRNKIIKEYNWQNAAEDTIKGYNKIV